jgi:hypothetical protein
LPGGAAAQVSSAVGFYEGYCTKVRLEGPMATTASVTSSNGVSSSSRTSAATAQATGATKTGGGSVTGTPSINSSSANGSGISKSDSIALGIGFGVGIPSLLIALVGHYTNVKRGSILGNITVRGLLFESSITCGRRIIRKWLTFTTQKVQDQHPDTTITHPSTPSVK